MISKYFHKKRTLINVTAHSRWGQTESSRTTEKEQKLQQITQLVLNIDFDAKKKKEVCGLSALSDVCLSA